MRPSASPFPLRWIGTSLENAGLAEERPDVGTYGDYAFDALPPLPIELRGDFAWLADAQPHPHHVGVERAAENDAALLQLQDACASIGLRLPEPFTQFMRSRALHQRVRSNTDCYLDLCPQPIASPVGGGHLIRFLADSQGCVFWYLYLTADGSDHAVVASSDFYGTAAEQWQDEPAEPGGISCVAESFEAFICRFWLENEIWFAAWEKTRMPAVGREYVERYRNKATV